MSVLSISQEKEAFSWANFWLYYLFFFYFSGLYQGIIYSNDISGGTGLRQAVYMSFLWLIPLLLFPRYSKAIAAITGLFVWSSSLMSMGYLALYGQDFSQSVLFILFESNWSESKEFLESYFSWWMLPALLFYSLIPFLIWQHTAAIQGSANTRILLIIIISAIILWPTWSRLLIYRTSFERAITQQMNYMEPAAPWHLVMGYIKYKKTLHEIEQHLLLNQKLPPIAGLNDSNAHTSNTLVLVIGESTNSQRMSLYGYQRNTSPQLLALKNELLIFDNVYAPRPYTIETLQQVLTFADETQPELYLSKPTLINIMKQAGYKTYWITNQQTQTKRNTMLTTFSKQADEQIYLNNNRSQDSAQYDEVVVKPFEKILQDKTERKFIIVHLLGTHRKYHYRYPTSYAYFTDTQGMPGGLSKRQQQEYNEYDNSVRYNDYIVARLIHSFKNSRNNGFLVYFSDHGEEVYDKSDHLFAGRNEAAPSSHMYTIPFLLWQSDTWKKHNPLPAEEQFIHRAYGASDFIYTWTDLAGIHFNEFDPSRSLVNPQFKQHPIWIGDPNNPKNLRDLRIQPFADRQLP